MRCIHCQTPNISAKLTNCLNCGVFLKMLYHDLLPTGTSLYGGEYLIEEVLGRGGFGVTYKAKAMALDISVALKEYFPQEFANRMPSRELLPKSEDLREPYERWRNHFRDEGRILARLNHPNIVQVKFLFEENNTIYLVMQLLEGQTLKEELVPYKNRGKGFPEQRVIEIMDAIVPAIALLHTQPTAIYHLDIKPSNVMVLPTGDIILIDFGSAKPGRDKTTTIARTDDYAPLELILAERYGSATDIFELGMMLHELLTGKLPPRALNRLHGRAKGWQPSLPAPWQSIISSSLRLYLRDRPRNVTAWWGRYQSWHKQEAEREEQRLVAAAEKERQRKIKKEKPEKTEKSQIVISRRQTLGLLLGASGFGCAILWNSFNTQNQNIPPTEIEPPDRSDKPLPPDTEDVESYPTFQFETVKLDEEGNIFQREQREAEYFSEDLGDGITLEMVKVEAGHLKLETNNPEKNEIDGEPKNTYVSQDLKVDAYWIGKYVVTQEQWDKIMSALIPNPSHHTFMGDKRPVEKVSWYEANAFCAALEKETNKKYRLPTEMEWEYACRAGTSTNFCFGNVITPEVVNANFTEVPEPLSRETQGETTIVGQCNDERTCYPPNAFGLYEMHGQVLEWCSEWIDETDQKDELKPLRGGCFQFPPNACQSGSQSGLPPDPDDDKGFITGFRVCLSA